MEAILKKAPILPVILLNDVKDALPLADALAEGGITTLEITLRTPAGLKAIEALAKRSDLTLGAGTIIEVSQLAQVKNAGATFAISPGITPALVTEAQKIHLPYLPAIATPSDILIAKQFDLSFLKFYPANLFGGINALKNYSVLFPQIKFCPTGGIDNKNLCDYLKLPNVVSVGGSWLVSSALIEKKDWKKITKLAEEAVRHVR